MTRRVKEQEMNAVWKLTPEKRYEYLAKRVADAGVIWGLKDQSGWMVYGDPSGQKCFPVWPFREFAEACATGEWSGCRAEGIPTRDWLEKWEPGMTRDGMKVAVFPTPGGKGAVLDPVAFDELVREELKKVED